MWRKLALGVIVILLVTIPRYGAYPDALKEQKVQNVPALAKQIKQEIQGAANIAKAESAGEQPDDYIREIDEFLAQQAEAGIVDPNFLSNIHYVLVDEEFVVQVNPNRRPGIRAVTKKGSEGKCCLCPENMPVGERGLPEKDNPSVVKYPNPRSIEKRHIVTATLKHIEQLITEPAHVRIAINSAMERPRFTRFINGKGAANSEDHFHNQELDLARAKEVTKKKSALPIESSRVKVIQEANNVTSGGRIRAYFLPRNALCPADVNPDLLNIRFGALEMAGFFVVYSDEMAEGLTGKKLRESLGVAGLDRKTFDTCVSEYLKGAEAREGSRKIRIGTLENWYAPCLVFEGDKNTVEELCQEVCNFAKLFNERGIPYNVVYPEVKVEPKEAAQVVTAITPGVTTKDDLPRGLIYSSEFVDILPYIVRDIKVDEVAVVIDNEARRATLASRLGPQVLVCGSVEEAREALKQRNNKLKSFKYFTTHEYDVPEGVETVVVARRIMEYLGRITVDTAEMELLQNAIRETYRDV